jgi:hypothetical protein
MEELFESPDFESFCEDAQRVPSLDANLLVACNGRSKNTAVELDWVQLVHALVQALDDIGCRPRQFSRAQARAIRKAQARAGLTSTLWEGWEALADAPPQLSKVNAMARFFGILSESGNDEVWEAIGADVFQNSEPRAEGLDREGLLGVKLNNVNVGEIHLIPMGDGRFLNVRAKCAQEGTQWKDKSPW